MTAVMIEPTASNSLTRELWISLASLLRSHVAMHSIGQPGARLRILAATDSRLEILGAYGKLSVLGPGESGVGSTEFRPEAGELGDEYSTFIFTEDGLILVEEAETPMDLEAVVEHWLRKVRG